jgi:voltage-gated potassium channel
LTRVAEGAESSRAPQNQANDRPEQMPKLRGRMRSADIPEQTLRLRIHRVLEAGRGAGPIGLALEIFLIALIAANAIAVTLDSVPRLALTYRTGFQVFEITSVVIFTIEYGLRLWTAPEDPRYSSEPVRGRFRYALQPYMLIDFFATAPAYIALFIPFADLRILRLFRLFRLLKIARYSPAVATLIHVLSLERRALFGTLLLLLCLMCMSAEGMYIIEGQAQPNVFGNLPNCMYWAIITLTTVGYGDTTPITAAGKIWAGLTAVIGLGMFAIPVGIIASAFVTEIHRRDFVVTSSMLAHIPLFKDIDLDVMSELMLSLRAHMIAQHSPIVVEGENANAMYFVVSGEAKAKSAAFGVRRTLRAGDVIGGDAALSGKLHEWTVFAHTPMRLLALSSQDLAVMSRKFPRFRRKIERLYGLSEKRQQRRAERRGRGSNDPDEGAKESESGNDATKNHPP